MTAVLLSREAECRAIDRLLEAVRGGTSRVMVLRGEPGVGKSALLEYLLERAGGCRVARAAGVESEMELAFAGLHQLCAPLLDRLERLPGPQRDALGTAFGLNAGAQPDGFLIGLAVLGLLSEVAEEQPLLCVVDDAQWLDRASAQALGFVARRLLAEPLGLVFAQRLTADQDLADLPTLAVEGLRLRDARALFTSVIGVPLDERVRDRIVAETRGNPLALLELPHGLAPAELAGGFGLPGGAPLTSQIEQSFARRIAPLPASTRRLMLVAAAEPIGDSTLFWRAAERLEIEPGCAGAAAAAGLLEVDHRVRFRHPLVRSAVYSAASPMERQEVHRVLAEVTDAETDPDRRAWHRAHAATGPDEEVASELERSAGRAQARGGLAAAAAFLRQAAALTPALAARARRELAAAEAAQRTGAPAAALGLLSTAQAGPLDELDRARVDLMRAQIAFALDRGSDAPPLLLAAARRLEPLDAGLARDTYLDALFAVLFADRLAGGSMAEVAEAALAAPVPTQPPGTVDLVLEGLATLVADGYAAAVPTLRRALDAFLSDDLPRETWLRWIPTATHTALLLWDFESWRVLCARQVQLAREAGALLMLPIALSSRIVVHLFAGELSAAAVLVEEVETVTEATTSRRPPYGAIALAAWQGREAATSEQIDANLSEVVARGEGLGVTIAQWANAVLNNGLGRFEAALTAGEQAGEDPPGSQRAAQGVSTWGLVEQIEAAARSGTPERGADALRRLCERTTASGTEWALGTEARSRALLAEGEGSLADGRYGEAIDRLRRSGAAAMLARTHLVYGEWLRLERRRAEAREQLRTAHDMFTAMGMAAFADRAARELRATGETAHGRRPEALGVLTAQEAAVARLAREGLTNPEIGARLFISPRTVQYHLGKVFTKLGITARAQLEDALPGAPDAVQPVSSPRG